MEYCRGCLDYPSEIKSGLSVTSKMEETYNKKLAASINISNTIADSGEVSSVCRGGRSLTEK